MYWISLSLPPSLPPSLSGKTFDQKTLITLNYPLKWGAIDNPIIIKYV